METRRGSVVVELSPRMFMAVIVYVTRSEKAVAVPLIMPLPASR